MPFTVQCTAEFDTPLLLCFVGLLVGAGGAVMACLLRPIDLVERASHVVHDLLLLCRAQCTTAEADTPSWCLLALYVCMSAGGAVMACLLRPPDVVEAASHATGAGKTLWKSWLGPNELSYQVRCCLSHQTVGLCLLSGAEPL
jgi:hypothetical protein